MHLPARLVGVPVQAELLAVIHQATGVLFRRHYPRLLRPRRRRHPVTNSE
jgi:hypothetical protein